MTNEIAISKVALPFAIRSVLSLYDRIAKIQGKLQYYDICRYLFMARQQFFVIGALN